jgi:hypothetical protein
MGERFQAALVGKEIVDIGAEQVFKTAGAVSKYGKRLVAQGVMHEDLYAQALGYMKQAALMKQTLGVPSRDLPRMMAQYSIGPGGQLLDEPVKFAGWQLGLLHEARGLGTLEAHVAGADVAGTRALAQINKPWGEGEVVTWAKGALKNKLISSAKAVSSPKKIPFEQLMETARGMEVTRPDIYRGFATEFQAELRQQVAERGGRWEDIVQNRGLIEADPIRIRQNQIASKLAARGRNRWATWTDEALSIARGHKGKIAFGAAAIGFYAKRIVHYLGER